MTQAEGSTRLYEKLTCRYNHPLRSTVRTASDPCSVHDTKNKETKSRRTERKEQRTTHWKGTSEKKERKKKCVNIISLSIVDFMVDLYGGGSGGGSG